MTELAEQPYGTYQYAKRTPDATMGSPPTDSEIMVVASISERDRKDIERSWRVWRVDREIESLMSMLIYANSARRPIGGLGQIVVRKAIARRIRKRVRDVRRDFGRDRAHLAIDAAIHGLTANFERISRAALHEVGVNPDVLRKKNKRIDLARALEGSVEVYKGKLVAPVLMDEFVEMGREMGDQGHMGIPEVKKEEFIQSDLDHQFQNLILKLSGTTSGDGVLIANEALRDTGELNRVVSKMAAEAASKDDALQRIHRNWKAVAAHLLGVVDGARSIAEEAYDSHERAKSEYVRHVKSHILNYVVANERAKTIGGSPDHALEGLEHIVREAHYQFGAAGGLDVANAAIEEVKNDLDQAWEDQVRRIGRDWLSENGGAR